MTPSNHISVLGPLLVGMATIVCTIVVHGLMLGMVITVVRRDLLQGRVGVRFRSDLTFVTSVTVLALVSHLVEIAIWAVTFDLCGGFPDFGAAFCHSVVDYTTLGDSIVISGHWRLLEPLAAADGMLMFGVSTAMIFAVVQRLIETRLGFLDPQNVSVGTSKIN